MTRALPWVFAAVHAALVIYMLAPKEFEPYPGPKQDHGFSFSGWHMSTSMMVAGRDIHHDQLGLALMLADFPVMLLLALAERAAVGKVSPMAASYVFAWSWLLGGSAWWYVLTRISLRGIGRTTARTGA